MQRVIVLTTGGTIEKIYNERTGALENQSSIIKNHLLDHLRLKHTSIEVIALMSKDSLDMTEEDRVTICHAIRDYCSMEIPILVLHGTDTLEQTARYCWKHFTNVTVPVVFTGAMKPLGYMDSDAGQNFIEALTAGKLLGPGYYVAFHGGIFMVPHVTKDHRLGTFIKKPWIE